MLNGVGATSHDELLAALTAMVADWTTSSSPPGIAPSEMADDGSPSLSFLLTALDEYVYAPDTNFDFTVATTFAGAGFDGYVLKLTSQEWRTADEVNRTVWEHWLTIAVPHIQNTESSTALLVIVGGNNTSTTPPSNFSLADLGLFSWFTGTVVAELRMVPNQPLTFTANGEDAGTFFVPGEPGEQVNLTFQFDGAPGGFLSSIGYYDVSAISADPVLAKRDYAVEAIGSGTVLFDERIHAPGTTVVVSLPADTELGFFLIPNDTAANFLADPDAFYDPPANSGNIFTNRRSPLFSLPAANPGELDQMQTSIRAGASQFSFEDLTRIPGGSSNQSFDDVLISVDVELVPAPLPPGSDFFGLGRGEDALIAYSFDKFFATGDETWPALLPMVKSAVRAMDAVQQFVPTIASGLEVDDFVVGGGSKRGWTTWLTAAVDAASASPRVKAIMPAVFDALNLSAQMAHHQAYYEGVTDAMVGGFSNAIQDYTRLSVQDRLDTPEGQALLAIVDPYEYLDRLTMPKFMVNSTGDEFFVPDSGQFYLDDLPGQNYLRFVPNTNHDVLNDSDAAESLLLYYRAIVDDLPLPQYSWSVEDDGSTIRVESVDAPLQVNLWQAVNYDSRDFRRSVTGINWTSSPLVDQGGGVYVAHVAEPNIGARAFFVELVYPGFLFLQHKFTTRVSVLSAKVETPVEPTLEPQLLFDVNGSTRPLYPRELTVAGNLLFFTADDGIHGRELWKSDGTVEGTMMVADIQSGPLSSYPLNLTVVGESLFFTAHDAEHGHELWRSDGTTEGTMLVADIRPGPNSSSPSYLTDVGGMLFFTAVDDAHGRELWKSDGTAGGTMLVADILPGSPFGYPRGSFPENLTDVGGMLFFTAYHDDYGRELWTSDGSAEGTVLVKDILPGSPYGYTRSSDPRYLTSVEGKLFFTARDDEHGRELWTSDGTADGTMLVADILPGSPYGYPRGSYPDSLANVGGMLFFTAYHDDYGRELWKSDGTAEGTMLVADLRPGSPYGYPRSSYPYGFTSVGGMLFFTASHDDYGRELWTSDGTAEGTMLVADIRPGSPYGYPRSSYPESLTGVGGMLFFTAYHDDFGRELWKSDGTAEGTMLVADIRPGSPYGYPRSSYPNYLTTFQGKVFFTAFHDDDRGHELWMSNGTAEGTVRIKNIMGSSYGSYPYNFIDVNGTLFFTADDGLHGRELWKNDGTAGGTMLVADIQSGRSGSYPQNLRNVNGTLFFTAFDNEHGRELWKSDGTAEGTMLVADIRPGSPYGYPRGSDPDNLTNVGGMLFFTAYHDDYGRELWKSDGTAEGTMLVADIRPGSPYGYPRSSYPNSLTNVGGMLFFTAFDDAHGSELWQSDGTAEGTAMVKDIQTGTTSSAPQNLTSVNGTLFFTAIAAGAGRELWKSVGTEGGTVMVKDIVVGASSSTPQNLTNVNGTLYFSANAADVGRELWKSDGSAGGTIMVRDLFEGGSSSTPQSLTNVNGTLFFSAITAGTGRELWKSDGTGEGTTIVKNIRPGLASSTPDQLTSVGGMLFFTANDGTHGRELWQSDGTVGGTVMVADARPGLAGLYPSNLTNVGGTLFFSANDPRYGQEPWLLVQPVEVDIRPGDFANNINLASKGMLTVAVQGSESFDAGLIDVSTVTLAGAPVVLKNNGKLAADYNDVDGDGFLDLVLRFAVEDLQLTTADTTALLEGKLLSGQRIRGSDVVHFVGQAAKGKQGLGADFPPGNGIAHGLAKLAAENLPMALLPYGNSPMEALDPHLADGALAKSVPEVGPNHGASPLSPLAADTAIVDLMDDADRVPGKARGLVTPEAESADLLGANETGGPGNAVLQDLGVASHPPGRPRK